MKLNLVTFVWFAEFAGLVWLKFTGKNVKKTKMLIITAKATTAIKTIIGVETGLFGADFAGGTGLKVTT